MSSPQRDHELGHRTTTHHSPSVPCGSPQSLSDLLAAQISDIDLDGGSSTTRTISLAPKSISAQPSPTLLSFKNVSPHTTRPNHVVVHADKAEIEALETAKQRALQRNDKWAAWEIDQTIERAKNGVVVPHNYLGMPYTPNVHGPLRKIDLGGRNMQFVYWDTNLGGMPKYLYSCTIMPEGTNPHQEYDWRSEGVQVFTIGEFDSLSEITKETFMTVISGQKLFIRVNDQNGTSIRDTTIQMDGVLRNSLLTTPQIAG
ncbi:hypothetical protein V5O48_014248 [Marasmius crinis-equi]|uniref:Uncharacterized protein n=1 Tax=Marasmius crinis-equi TaxID=585013 RepID=A0ABR3EY69_9AGAR